MGKILEKISQPPIVRRQTVEWKGETYTLVGTPDANLLGRTLLITEDRKNLYARLFGADLEDGFDPSIVPQVLLVAECLEHEDDPSARYDMSQIAKLAVSDGILLAQLFAAAARCVGLDDGPLDAIAEAAAGE